MKIALAKDWNSCLSKRLFTIIAQTKWAKISTNKVKRMKKNEVNRLGSMNLFYVGPPKGKGPYYYIVP